jgi:hypothetical protein
MARRPHKQTQPPRWQIVAIRKRGYLLGVIEAKDAQTAIELWIERYIITDPDERRRLAAYPFTA